ncbi:MAG: hypothetical protein HY020_07590 [Burkholderiales bacterium]|nr:hypothetical protein [Burkholderiales bacterium]
MGARFILDHSIDELDALARAAVDRAVEALHAQGVSTLFMEHGVLMEQAPVGPSNLSVRARCLVPPRSAARRVAPQRL